mmetsp:Transcript_5961/g.21260  ORF Transcript_5961/g.21260 Transcript_5961/m.21260 type:complete len:327 (-) Transcript_5961:1061-2041(-)
MNASAANPNTPQLRSLTSKRHEPSSAAIATPRRPKPRSSMKAPKTNRNALARRRHTTAVASWNIPGLHATAMAISAQDTSNPPSVPPTTISATVSNGVKWTNVAMTPASMENATKLRNINRQADTSCPLASTPSRPLRGAARGLIPAAPASPWKSPPAPPDAAADVDSLRPTVTAVASSWSVGSMVSFAAASALAAATAASTARACSAAASALAAATAASTTSPSEVVAGPPIEATRRRSSSTAVATAANVAAAWVASTSRKAADTASSCCRAAFSAAAAALSAALRRSSFRAADTAASSASVASLSLAASPSSARWRRTSATKPE